MKSTPYACMDRVQARLTRKRTKVVIRVGILVAQLLLLLLLHGSRMEICCCINHPPNLHGSRMEIQMAQEHNHSTTQNTGRAVNCTNRQSCSAESEERNKRNSDGYTQSQGCIGIYTCAYACGAVVVAEAPPRNFSPKRGAIRR